MPFRSLTKGIKMAPATGAVAEAAELLRARLRELDAERAKLERALASLTDGREGKRGPGRPRGSGTARPHAPAPAPRRHPRRARREADRREARDHRLGDRARTEDQAELHVPRARRAAEGRQGPQGRPAPTTRPSVTTQAEPRPATASRSSFSSATVASIRSREKSVISRPSTIEYSPPEQVHG